MKLPSQCGSSQHCSVQSFPYRRILPQRSNVATVIGAFQRRFVAGHRPLQMLAISPAQSATPERSHQEVSLQREKARTVRERLAASNQPSVTGRNVANSCTGECSSRLFPLCSFRSGGPSLLPPVVFCLFFSGTVFRLQWLIDFRVQSRQFPAIPSATPPRSGCALCGVLFLRPSPAR